MNEDNLKFKETEKSALLPHKSHCANPCHFSAVLSHIWMVDVPHEYHTLGMLQHFPSYQNTALKKNCCSDMMRIDLFLPYAVRM